MVMTCNTSSYSISSWINRSKRVCIYVCVWVVCSLPLFVCLQLQLKSTHNHIMSSPCNNVKQIHLMCKRRKKHMLKLKNKKKKKMACQWQRGYATLKVEHFDHVGFFFPQSFRSSLLQLKLNHPRLSHLMC